MDDAPGMRARCGITPDHRRADEAEGGAEHVEAVRSKAGDEDSPCEGAGDEHPAVGGENSGEIRILLERRDEAVRGEGGDPGVDPGRAPGPPGVPCQTSQVPPISATAAMTNRPIEGAMLTVGR